MTGQFSECADPGTWLRELPPELTGGLTFHLPLEVQALEIVGVERGVVRKRLERSLPGAFAAGLVDPPLYRWAEKRYAAIAADLLSDDAETRACAYTAAAPLGAGLAGAAFHGLIRLGYGSLRRDASEIARGLAYLRTRRQVLFSGEAGLDRDVVLPSPGELDGNSIFDQLHLVAGSPGVLRSCDVHADIPPVRTLCGEALRLLFRNPGSFVSVHAVDSLHALVEFDRLVNGAIPVEGMAQGRLHDWWRAYLWSLRACAVLVDASPPQPPEKTPVNLASLDALTDAAVESCEVHDIKVVVALRRLVEFGVVDEDSALEAGRAKLAATECSA
jgi:hypothetical protein